MMTTKLSFRARALDAVKPMPIYIQEDVPDLKELATINRTVPEMPTGMEKEEETEHHLQRAIIAQQCYGTATALVIPTPEVSCAMANYESLYEKDFKTPKQLIHVQALNLLEQEYPDYDMDEEDEAWLAQQQEKLNARTGQDSAVSLSREKFEEMMDRLEKGSGHQVLQLRDAKVLLKEDDDLITAVYEYWLKKRQSTSIPLLPSIKSEKRDGSTTNNPYVAFRRRTEKMQTRKNRKNDETSYEKMFKMGFELKRALSILEMVKKREKCKKELLQLTIEIFEKRYQLQDFDGSILKDVKQLACQSTSSSVYPTQNPSIDFAQYFKGVTPASWVEPTLPRQESRKRPGKRNKRKKLVGQMGLESQGATPLEALGLVNPIGLCVANDGATSGMTAGNRALSPLGSGADSPHLGPAGVYDFDGASSEEETASPLRRDSDVDDESDADGPFAFKRNKDCQYLAPKSDGYGFLPWESDSRNEPSSSLQSSRVAPDSSAPSLHLLTDLRYRYTCTAIRSRHHPYNRRRGWRRQPVAVSVDEHGVERELRYSCDRVVGFARRRRGRGGRSNLDRGWTPLDDAGSWNRVPPERTALSPTGEGTPSVWDAVPGNEGTEEKLRNGLPSTDELKVVDAEEWTFFRPGPRSPTLGQEIFDNAPSEHSYFRSSSGGSGPKSSATAAFGPAPPRQTAEVFARHKEAVLAMQRTQRAALFSGIDDHCRFNDEGSLAKFSDVFAAQTREFFASFSNESTSFDSRSGVKAATASSRLHNTNEGTSSKGPPESVVLDTGSVARAISALSVPTGASKPGLDGAALFQHHPSIASTASTGKVSIHGATTTTTTTTTTTAVKPAGNARSGFIGFPAGSSSSSSSSPRPSPLPSPSQIASSSSTPTPPLVPPSTTASFAPVPQQQQQQQHSILFQNSTAFMQPQLQQQPSVNLPNHPSLSSYNSPQNLSQFSNNHQAQQHFQSLHSSSTYNPSPTKTVAPAVNHHNSMDNNTEQSPHSYLPQASYSPSVSLKNIPQKLSVVNRVSSPSVVQLAAGVVTPNMTQNAASVPSSSPCLIQGVSAMTQANPLVPSPVRPVNSMTLTGAQFGRALASYGAGRLKAPNAVVTPVSPHAASIPSRNLLGPNNVVAASSQALLNSLMPATVNVQITGAGAAASGATTISTSSGGSKTPIVSTAPAPTSSIQLSLSSTPAIGTAAVLTNSKSQSGQLTSLAIPLAGVAANATPVVQQQQQRLLAAEMTQSLIHQQLNPSSLGLQRSPGRLIGQSVAVPISLPVSASSDSQSPFSVGTGQMTIPCTVISSCGVPQSSDATATRSIGQALSNKIFTPGAGSSLTSLPNKVVQTTTVSRNQGVVISGSSPGFPFKTAGTLKGGVLVMVTEGGNAPGVVDGVATTASSTATISGSLGASSAKAGSSAASQRQQAKSFIKLSNNVIQQASSVGIAGGATGSSLNNKIVSSSSTSSSPSPSSSISSSSSVSGLPNHPSASPHVAAVAVSLLNGPSK